ncbi:MAG: Ni/Fe hydrogenase subunit alpha [Hyphomicrobiales bacterium]|nr:MAG: Ni/Fe hydrogenase subunit alpha [Hyphomicrobiales bacterium]
MNDAAVNAGDKTSNRIIKVDALARVEGEGALYLKVRENNIEDLKFTIYEPPRFFEALLEGRAYKDAPDITARICGICPMAYIMGASQAMEQALGVKVGGQLRNLRRLAYCGEWIESHVLHAFLLHAPDFMGYEDSIQLSKDHPELVRNALDLKKTGNEIIEVLGGRAIHPINLKVGGFHALPKLSRVKALREALKRGLDTSLEMTRAVGGFDFPDYEHDYLCVSLHHPDEYAITEGNIVTNRGLSIPVAEFEEHFDEEHVEHSNALHGVMKGESQPYLTGPIARYNNNFGQLSLLCHEIAKQAKLPRVVKNPFQSILVRLVETVYAFEEALRLVDIYEPPAACDVALTPRAGRGAGCTEAPRGICYHRYDLDAAGDILAARIVPPTSQNQKQIEQDLHGVASKNLALDDEKLKYLCEQSIRNYDPCISCATHFLKLTVDRD